MMFVCHYLIGLPAHDKVFDVVRSEVLLRGGNGLQSSDQLLGCLSLFLGMQTVIAVAAVLFLVGLSEIV